MSRHSDSHTEDNRHRYARIAPLYDLLDRAFERHYRPGRAMIGARASGITIEVGAGTGKNFAYYRPASRVFASDLSTAMLDRARRKAGGPIKALVTADAAELPFPDDVADTVVATFVCCVQKDPKPSLLEMARVLKPGGQMLCLDYTIPESKQLRALMRLIEAPLRVVYGIHWDHDVPELLEAVGLRVRDVRRLWGPAVRYIAAERSNLPISSAHATRREP